MTEQELLSFYHDVLNNVGAYTSVSFATLGYSRFHRNKNKVLNISLIIASLAFLTISIFITKYLIDDFQRFQQFHLNRESPELNKWLFIPKIILYFNSAIFILGLYTLYGEIKKH